MRMEVHVHGSVQLRPGIKPVEIDEALRSWFEYLDIDSLEEAKSIHHDEPGVLYDARTHVLEICWSGDVGRSFKSRIEPALRGLCPLSEAAAEIEVTYYDDDGNDEANIVFVGPDEAAIHEAQRRRMIEDVSALLARHFDDASIAQVVSVVDELFAKDWLKHGEQASTEPTTTETPLPRPSRKHLH
jgi:phenylpyruvate tautomerase PptA (4-oxalocrotonate tautomerase family)